jgi:hypothetical protein
VQGAAAVDRSRMTFWPLHRFRPATQTPENGDEGSLSALYDGELADTSTVLPLVAVGGAALGLDWLILLVVMTTIFLVVLSRRRRSDP